MNREEFKMPKPENIPQEIEISMDGNLLVDSEGKKYRYSEDGEKYGGDFPEKTPQEPLAVSDNDFELPPPPKEENLVI